MNILYIYF